MCICICIHICISIRASRRLKHVPSVSPAGEGGDSQPKPTDRAAKVRESEAKARAATCNEAT
jgi:hypothetical protein